MVRRESTSMQRSIELKIIQTQIADGEETSDPTGYCTIKRLNSRKKSPNTDLQYVWNLTWFSTWGELGKVFHDIEGKYIEAILPRNFSPRIVVFVFNLPVNRYWNNVRDPPISIYFSIDRKPRKKLGRRKI